MATYTGQITVPNSDTWQIGGAGYYLFFQSAANIGSIASSTDLNDYISQVAVAIGFDYTITVGSTDTIIDITWNFTDTGVGNPSAIAITSDQSSIYSTSLTTSTTTTCPTCLELTKAACQSSYTFVAGLTASTDYWVVIDNNRNKRYVQQVTTDGSGDFVIDATAPEFPEGFFIPEQFTYTLKVYTTAELTTEAEITYNNTIYNCITLSFMYSVTTTSSMAGVDLWVDDSLNFVIDDTFNTISVG